MARDRPQTLVRFPPPGVIEGWEEEGPMKAVGCGLDEQSHMLASREKTIRTAKRGISCSTLPHENVAECRPAWLDAKRTEKLEQLRDERRTRR